MKKRALYTLRALFSIIIFLILYGLVRADMERINRIEEHLKQRQQVKEAFSGFAKIRGNWQLLMANIN